MCEYTSKFYYIICLNLFNMHIIIIYHFRNHDILKRIKYTMYLNDTFLTESEFHTQVSLIQRK